MVAEDTEHSRLSKFSLAVAADSGWYVPDFPRAQRLFWGRNAGCAFASGEICKDPSNVPPEICGKQEIEKCSRDFKAKVSCLKTRFTGDCRIASKPVMCGAPGSGSSYETFSRGAACQALSVNGQKFAGCFEVQCASDRSSYLVKTTAANGRGSSLKCGAEGQQLSISGFPIAVICQNPAKFCAEADSCSLLCGNRWDQACNSKRNLSRKRRVRVQCLLHRKTLPKLCGVSPRH